MLSPKQLLIQPDNLSQPEQLLIQEMFHNPTLVKYLKIIGREAVLELASLSALAEQPHELALKHSYVAGKLAVLELLLSITTEE